MRARSEHTCGKCYSREGGAPLYTKMINFILHQLYNMHVIVPGKGVFHFVCVSQPTLEIYGISVYSNMNAFEICHFKTKLFRKACTR